MSAISEEELEHLRKKRELLYQNMQEEAEKATAHSEEKIGDMQGKKVIDRTPDNALATMITLFQRTLHQPESGKK